MVPTRSRRRYNISDAKMVIRAGVVSSLFVEDEETFTDYSLALFHEEYLTIFKNKINMIYTTLSDKEIHKNLAIHTQNVERCIEEIQLVYAKIMIFANIAFFEDEVTLKLVGKGSIKSFKSSHNSFQCNMNRVALIFKSEKTSLIKAGCSEACIEEFHLLCEKLIGIHEDQENYKITRTGLTKERIKLLNDIYGTMVQLNEVAKVVWADDKEYASRYDLPQSSSHSNDKDDLEEEVSGLEIEMVTR